MNTTATKTVSTILNNRIFQFFLGVATITGAIIAILEYQKKSKQYDLVNQKTMLDIEKTNLEIQKLRKY